MLSANMLPLLALLLPMASATSGSATFYGGNTQGGMCSFSSYTIPSNLFGTALSSKFWDGSKACGACVEVTGPDNNKITAMVVDQCPGGCDGHDLDLFQSAFLKLAEAKQGIINVSWKYVNCPITTPLQVRMKEGVSAYWFSAQAVNANKRVKDLQISTNGGSTWQSGLERMDYNFFQKSSGFGTSTVSVKVISIDGNEVIINGCSVKGGQLCTAKGNF